MGKNSQKFCLFFIFIALYFPLISAGHQITIKTADSETETSKTGLVINKARSCDDGLDQNYLLNQREMFPIVFN